MVIIVCRAHYTQKSHKYSIFLLRSEIFEDFFLKPLPCSTSGSIPQQRPAFQEPARVTWQNVSNLTANNIVSTHLFRKLKRLEPNSNDFVIKVYNFVEIANNINN